MAPPGYPAVGRLTILEPDGLPPTKAQSLALGRVLNGRDQLRLISVAPPTVRLPLRATPMCTADKQRQARLGYKPAPCTVGSLYGRGRSPTYCLAPAPAGGQGLRTAERRAEGTTLEGAGRRGGAAGVASMVRVVGGAVGGQRGWGGPTAFPPGKGEIVPWLPGQSGRRPRPGPTTLLAAPEVPPGNACGNCSARCCPPCWSIPRHPTPGWGGALSWLTSCQQVHPATALSYYRQLAPPIPIHIQPPPPPPTSTHTHPKCVRATPQVASRPLGG